jgi:hypothetical protein
MIPVNVLVSISVAHYAPIHLFLITLPTCATRDLFKPTVLKRSCVQFVRAGYSLAFNEFSSFPFLIFPSLFTRTHRPRRSNAQIGSLLAHSTIGYYYHDG